MSSIISKTLFLGALAAIVKAGPNADKDLVPELMGQDVFSKFTMYSGYLTIPKLLPRHYITSSLQVRMYQQLTQLLSGSMVVQDALPCWDGLKNMDPMQWKMVKLLSTITITLGTEKLTCCTLKVQVELDIPLVEARQSAHSMMIHLLRTTVMLFCISSKHCSLNSKKMIYTSQESHMLEYMYHSL